MNWIISASIIIPTTYANSTNRELLRLLLSKFDFYLSIMYIPNVMRNLRGHPVETPPEHEEELVSKIKEGDQLAFKFLFRKYYSSLCRFTYRLVHSNEDVEDIVQSVFENIWINREKLDPGQSIRSYLFKSARNKALNNIRDNHEEAVDFGDKNLQVVSWQDSFQDMVDRELAAAVDEAIEKLPLKCKLVFTLNRQEGLSYSEIADVLGISKKTVENHIARAFDHLRKSLKDFIG